MLQQCTTAVSQLAIRFYMDISKGATITKVEDLDRGCGLAGEQRQQPHMPARVSLSQWTSDSSRPVAVTPPSAHRAAWFRLMKSATPDVEPSDERLLASRTAQDTQKKAAKVCLRCNGEEAMFSSALRL